MSRTPKAIVPRPVKSGVCEHQEAPPYRGRYVTKRQVSDLRNLFLLPLLLLGALLALGNASAADTVVIGWGRNSDGGTSIPAGLNNVVSLSASDHSMALKADGTIVAWGANYSGQTNVPAGLSNVTAIAAAYGHSVAVKNDGTVVAWGNNWYGQTDVPPAATNVLAVATGESHTLALRRDGTVLAWGGRNYYGETNVPAHLNTNVVGIAAGYDFNLLLKSDGTVAAWGDNRDGATNIPPGLSNVTAIAAGYYHAVALKSDGTVFTWGRTYGSNEPPAGLSNVVAVSARYQHTLALKSDGTVLAWGDNTYGQTSVPPGLTPVTALAAGVQYSLAATGDSPPYITQQPANRFGYTGGKLFLEIKASGSLPLSYQWQFNGADIPEATNAAIFLPNLQLGNSGEYCVVVSNALGSVTSSNCVVRVSQSPPLMVQEPASAVSYPGGTVAFHVAVAGSEPFTYQWLFQGTNLPGATAPTLLLTNLQKAEAGNYSVVVQNAFGSATNSSAVLSIGAIAAWGDNYYRQCDVPPELTNVIAVAGGYYHSLALKGDGTVAAWGYNGHGQTNVPAGLTNVVAVAAGMGHSLALKGDGTVVSWGWNADGQTNVPAGVTNVVAIAAGESHSLALTAEGILYAWGWGYTGGQVILAGLELTNLVAIAAGRTHNLALRPNGEVVFVASFNKPANVTNAVAVSTRYDFSMLLKADGTPVVWGSNLNAQTNIPPDLTNAVAIAAGTSHCLALKADGTVAGWGKGSGSQIPPGLTNVVRIAAGAGHSLAIIGDGPPATFAHPVSLSHADNQFTMAVPTSSGKVYRLEYRDSLASGEWNILPLIPGNGGLKLLSPPSEAPQRFYQIRQW